MRCVIYLRVSTSQQAERDLTEEGFSIPAQREACVRHIRDQGWTLIDEYSDRGESARSADRPQLQAMLARIEADRDVDAVVVHKIDRLARNMEDHVAIRAALRRRDVALASVTENLEETASGRLVEGIHALMAEFYSSNLSSEIRKGMSQKAKMGGWPHQAPLGYRNIRESIGGRQVAHIMPDPERAPLIRLAFELYATGEYTLERLATELEHRGLRNRGRRNARPKPLTLNGLSTVLHNKAYTGVVEWNGVEYPGRHEPLIEAATFQRVQDLLDSRSVRGTRANASTTTTSRATCTAACAGDGCRASCPRAATCTSSASDRRTAATWSAVSPTPLRIGSKPPSPSSTSASSCPTPSPSS